MNNIMISLSGYNRLMTCPKSYDIHYNERLRPRTTSTALLFGAAMDAAFESILHRRPEDPYLVYTKTFGEHDIIECQYDDYDPDLLEPDQYDSKEIRKILNKQRYRGFTSLTKKEARLLTSACVDTLEQKSILLINAYIDSVMPQIKKVHSTQKTTDLKLPNGDIITGIADIIADVKGHGLVLLDNKTTNKPYDSDAVGMSAQLALYCYMNNIEKAGYIVLNKNIIKNKKRLCKECQYDASGTMYKTCPNMIDRVRCRGEFKEDVSFEVQTQIIIDKVPQFNVDLVMDSLIKGMEMVRQKLFPRNFNACLYTYGKPCPNIDYCWKGNKDKLNKKED